MKNVISWFFLCMNRLTPSGPTLEFSRAAEH